jgi:uncharacterized membrane protein YeiH
MPIHRTIGIVEYVMDLIGILAFSLSGAFLGVRKDFDVFGVVILAEATGLGGGLFRDTVIGVRPVAFSDAGYFSTPIVGGLIGFLSAGLQCHERAFDVFDAGALGLFSVTGTTTAFAHGLNTPASVTLGIATAAGGGVISCLLAMELPSLLRANRDLYALPALLGAGAVGVLHHFQVLNVWTAPAAAVGAFGLRVMALRRSWRTPRSRFWHNPFAGMRHVPHHEPKAPERDLTTLSPSPVTHHARVPQPDMTGVGTENTVVTPLPPYVETPLA